jgi:hypothetical protein
MNIVDNILQCISSKSSGRDFAFSSATEDVRDKFHVSLIDFLKAPTIMSANIVVAKYIA